MARTKEEKEALKAAGYKWHSKTQRWLLDEEIEEYEKQMAKAHEVNVVLYFFVAPIAIIFLVIFTLITNSR